MFLCDNQWKQILKQIFWKTKTSFKKLEYCLLVESTKIENASFLYKTTIPEVNVKTNRMISTETITKNGVLPVLTYFLKFLLQFKNPL